MNGIHLPQGLRDFLRRLQLRKGVMWQEYQQGADLSVTTDINEAQIATSVVEPAWEEPILPDGAWVKHHPARHAVLLDLDVPAYLVPSSTEGHSHLYIDVPGGVEHETYMHLLECLADAGIIEEGYSKASQGRGFTALRLPWVKKEDAPKPATAEGAARQDELVF